MSEGPLQPAKLAHSSEVAFAGLAPFAFEGHALPEAVGRQLLVT